jgi:hypothetical protein
MKDCGADEYKLIVSVIPSFATVASSSKQYKRKVCQTYMAHRKCHRRHAMLSKSKNGMLPEQTSHHLNRFSSVTSLKSLSNALLNNAGCCVKDHWTHLGMRPLPDSEAAKAGKAWAGKPDGLLCVARLSKCPMSKSRLICSRSERRAGVSSLACEAVSSSSGEPARKP